MFNAALLQCGFYSQDWSSVGLLHVYGSAVVPRSVYVVRSRASVAGPCGGVVVVDTAKWGDVVAPFYPTPSQPSYQDITAVVDKFQGKPTGPSKTRTLLQPRTPNPLELVGFLDVAAAMDAFQGDTFVEKFPLGPESCP